MFCKYTFQYFKYLLPLDQHYRPIIPPTVTYCPLGQLCKITTCSAKFLGKKFAHFHFQKRFGKFFWEIKKFCLKNIPRCALDIFWAKLVLGTLGKVKFLENSCKVF